MSVCATCGLDGAPPAVSIHSHLAGRAELHQLAQEMARVTVEADPEGFAALTLRCHELTTGDNFILATRVATYLRWTLRTIAQGTGTTMAEGLAELRMMDIEAINARLEDELDAVFEGEPDDGS